MLLTQLKNIIPGKPTASHTTSEIKTIQNISIKTHKSY
jgi:hypothetical protein